MGLSRFMATAPLGLWRRAGPLQIDKVDQGASYKVTTNAGIDWMLN